VVEPVCAVVRDTATDVLAEVSPIWPGEITPVGLGDGGNDDEPVSSTGVPNIVYVCVSIVPSAPRVVRVVV
jgi:hypothetical protein